MGDAEREKECIFVFCQFCARVSKNLVHVEIFLQIRKVFGVGISARPDLLEMKVSSLYYDTYIQDISVSRYRLHSEV